MSGQGLHRMYQRSTLPTYRDAVTWFSRARSPTKGRPFGRWGLVTRTFDPNQFDGKPTFNILVNGRLICTISPDNKLTMRINGNDGSVISNTLSASLYRLVPVNWTRAGKKRYRILATGGLTTDSNFWMEAKGAPELFDGLELDLSTHLFTNAKPDMLTRVNSDKRRDWLRAVRKFKAQIKMRAKLGVFDAIQDEVSKLPVEQRNKAHPDWDHPTWIDLLYTSMRDEVYPKVLLAGFVMSISRVYWSSTARQTPMHKKIPAVVTNIIDANSVELRARFGVFNDE